VSLNNRTKCATWTIAQRYVIISNKVTRETGIHYSDKLAVLQTKKNGFEGSNSTTRITRWCWWPEENNSRDQNPWLERQDGTAGPSESNSWDENPLPEKHGGIAGPREIVQGMRIHNSKNMMALLAQEK
jgi:hypothetical protein